MIDNAPVVLGITSTSQDVIDVADDIVPLSMRIDDRHLTTGANSNNTFVAQKFAEKVLALGD